MSNVGKKVGFAFAGVLVAGAGIVLANLPRTGVYYLENPPTRNGRHEPGGPGTRTEPSEVLAAAKPDKPTLAPPVPVPSPLSPEVAKALGWLVEKQGKDGGFGQNDGAEPDVANTAIAALALIKAGNTPTSGPYRDAVRAAVEFVRREVAASEDGTPLVTNRTGTQPQRKIGPYVDTFLAAQLLGEVDGRMPDLAAQGLVRTALERCVAKIEKCQSEDGSFNQGGWAPVLGSTFACKALQMANEKGVRVDRDVLARAEDYMLGLHNKETGQFSSTAGAGVALYSTSGALYSLATAARPATEEVRAAVKELKNPDVVRGFGSMGGEEFVSYMMASTSIASVDGQSSVQWNAQIRENLAKLQNADGSWAGHHCITGRVFCTAAAVLTLVAENAPAPTSTK